MKYLRYMLVFLPLALLVEYVWHNDLLIFLFSALALVPLAGYLGEATEELAIHTGPKIGGLLNATLGNAAELIITIVALNGGKYELVKASITGSIFGNLLLILGASLLFGGLKNGVQRFDRTTSGVSATLMLLAVIGLLIPTIFELFQEVQAGAVNLFDTEVHDLALSRLSLWVAGVLMVMYILSLVFSFTTPERGVGQPVGVDDHQDDEHKAKWSVPVAVGVLAAATIAIVFLSEFLVGAVEPVVKTLGVSELFLGIIIIPIVGNVAEHIVGVQVAIKNKMDLSMAISLGSSTQVALFVAPLLVFISRILYGPERELTLFFTLFEVIALGAAVLAASFVSQDGESNWLEGAMLLAIYAIFAFGFFFLPVTL